MRQSQPIVRNGVCKDQHVDRIVGEHISFSHIVSYDNISESVNINIRVNDIDVRILGRSIVDAWEEQHKQPNSAD